MNTKYPISVTRCAQSHIHEVDFDHLPFGKYFSDHMFVVDYIQGEWVSPRIVPLSDFSLHPATMAIHYGQALFEGMKASRTPEGKIFLFRPDMHAKRLNCSAERLCMPALPEDLFMDGLRALLQVDADWVPNREGHSLYIRPTMFATDAHVGVRPSETYRFFIMASPVGAYYSRPIRLRVETEYVRAIRGGTGEAKAAGNYAGALLATREAQAAGFDQVLWMDGVSFKYIQEVGTMNIFFIIDGKIVTPATDGAILKGITRNSLLQLFQEKGLVVEERPITIDEIVEAFHAGKLEDAFGAGTAAVISYISEIAYGDLVITLPPVESRSVSRMAKDEIEGMRSGRIADRHGWIVPVEVGVPVG
jgi:branched-chain amino acid aminotransferase